MLTKSKTALAAALIAGSASVALADEQFDVSIYRPIQPPHPLALQGGGSDAGAYAQATWGTVRAAQPRAVKPFTIEEKLLFERMSRVD